MAYTLKASLFSHDDLETEIVTLHPELPTYGLRDLGFQATADAVLEILNKADTSLLWHYGHIELFNPEGEVIFTMESKQRKTRDHFEAIQSRRLRKG